MSKRGSSKPLLRSRNIRSATDLLRGILADVYTAHSFQHLSLWSVLIGLAEVSANAWRKRLRKASAWLDWLFQEVLAMAAPVSPWLVRAGLTRILLIDATHWKCVGPHGSVWRVHTAFDLLAGRLTQVKVTDCHEGEHLEVFDLHPGDLVVTDRANGLRTRIVFVLSKMAEIVVRISPSRFPMETEHGKPIMVLEWRVGTARVGWRDQESCGLDHGGQEADQAAFAGLAFERAATGEGRAEDQTQSEQDPAEEATQARCISLDGSWWSRPCHRTVGAIGTSCNCI